MSYDIIADGDVPWVDVNITFNLRNILDLAFNVPYWIDEIDDREVWSTVDRIEAALLRVLRNRRGYAELEPTNGWGNVDDVIVLLQDMYECAYWANQSKTTGKWRVYK